MVSPLFSGIPATSATQLPSTCVPGTNPRRGAHADVLVLVVFFGGRCLGFLFVGVLMVTAVRMVIHGVRASCLAVVRARHSR